MPRPVWLVMLLLTAPRLHAQEASSRLPVAAQSLEGFDAAVTIAGAHDSYLGWYNVVTPTVSYMFSPRYSADLTMSVYPYRLAGNPDPGAIAKEKLVPANGSMGDMLLEVHGAFTPGVYRDTATVSMTLPTGNRADGFGTGQATFNVDNRLERYVSRTGLLLDIGGGDSSAFQNRLVTEEDSSLGPLAQFQAGLVRWISPNTSVQSLAYEQLPIGDQKTYTTIGRPPLRAATVVTGRKVIEDNGFNTTVNTVVGEHVMLTGSYNRSLRLHLDTVSLGVTFTLRSLPFRNSLIDKAMREAERGSGELIPPQ